MLDLTNHQENAQAYDSAYDYLHIKKGTKAPSDPPNKIDDSRKRSENGDSRDSKKQTTTKYFGKGQNTQYLNG